MTYQDRYSKKSKLYAGLVRELNEKYPEITLSSEYGYFVEDNLLQFLIRLARFKFAAKMVKKNDRVLEIGCGSGLGTNFLAQHCRRIKGIDVKSEELEEARSLTRRKNVDFELIDFFDMPSKSRYDAVVALDVIEHMPKADGRRLIKKTTAHLKKDGILIIGTPSMYTRKYQSPLSKASHIKLYDQEELRALIEAHYGRTLAFSMNDEVVHTGFSKLAWYYFVIAFMPKKS